jgi:ribosome-associated protein
MPALPAVPANRYDEARRAIDRMVTHHSHSETRILVQAAAAACEDKKAEDTRILELDPADSGLSDFFLVTSATNERQALAIADEIEMRLKRNHGVTPNSVEGRRHGEWILLDYVDFVVHVFLAERRAFYDIERLRKSARPFTPPEFEADLKHLLADKTRQARKKSEPKSAAAARTVKQRSSATPKKAAAKKAAPAKQVIAKKSPAAKPPAKKATAKEASAHKRRTK